MQKRGRKSAESLATVVDTGQIKRPEPPEELTPEQAIEWNTVVESLPPNWFGVETFGMLIQYCRHMVSSRKIAALIEDVDFREDVKEYDRLLKMQERESRASSALATRMRMTQQSTYDKSKKKPVQDASLWKK